MRLIGEYVKRLYTRFTKTSFGYFFQFTAHGYSVEWFDLKNIKGNLKTIFNIDRTDGLDATRQGMLIRLEGSKKRWFALKNTLLLGAYQARVERVVYFTFMGASLEINNPFDRSIAALFVERKLRLLRSALMKVERINQKWWMMPAVLLQLESYRRDSILASHVIKKMDRAVARQKKSAVVTDVQEALQMGMRPYLVIQGLSGTYWMRGTHRQTVGLFKPFDEEAYAPNNPIGAILQGALGKRRMRPGMRVGETAHREVAAFVVDAFLSLGIVPKTYYATFAHSAFYLSRALPSTLVRPKVKTKKGSFQEYIEGFVPLSQLPKDKWHEIPQLSFQLLVVLDVIIGNMDRNAGNILVGHEEIAAIDHGLTFPDDNLHLTTWYWTYLEQGKQPLYPSLLSLLTDFPTDHLIAKLAHTCFIDATALQRMRERLALFTAATLASLPPASIAPLYTPENLLSLRDLHTTLPTCAQAIVQDHLSNRHLA